MNKETADNIVNGVRLEEGKVYLRDKRNGRVFQYEEALAELRYIERFEYNGKLPEPASDGYETKITLSGIEKAAEWDRLASMKPDEREVELQKREEYARQQALLKEKTDSKPEETNDPYSDKELTLLSKEGPTLEDYRKQGWTSEQLVAHNLATKNE